MEEKEKKEEKTQNFKTVQDPNTYKNVYKNQTASKTKIGFGKSVLLPFLSGVVGCTLVLGTCFGIPSIRSKIVSTNPNSQNNTNSQASRICKPSFSF